MSFRSIINKYIMSNKYSVGSGSKHIAFLIKGKCVIKFAKNEYERQCFKGKSTTSLHAEINCVRQLKPKKNVKKFRLLVININKENGELKNSIPCLTCKKYLINKGFTHIYCSTKDGSIKKFKLNKIESKLTHSQKGFYKKF